MNARLTKFFLAIPHIPHLSFLWPTLLWLLLLVPLSVGLYVLLLYRRKKTALRYANLSMVKAAMGAVGWRRHVPPALMLLALTLLLIAVARPTAVVSLPSTRATVILAMDVSGSMRATDVTPSRVEAAQAAAKQYIKSQPKDVVIGIVAFAATAFLVQSPTVDHTALFNAIDHFELQRGTAVGSGILTALSSIFPREDFPIANYYSGGFGNGSGGFGFGGGDRFNRFGGRALGDDLPKYLNSPETPIYTKSNILYHLDRAKEALRQSDFAVLVEGYMDAIAVARAGIANVVASCGTSLAEPQIKLLGRFTRRVIVNYDPDTAGQAATERSIALLLESEFDVRVLARRLAAAGDKRPSSGHPEARELRSAPAGC